MGLERGMQHESRQWPPVPCGFVSDTLASCSTFGPSAHTDYHLLQVAWVGHLAQPLLAMHAWRSLWVVAKTTAACLRSPKLLLRNLRYMVTSACR